jgi:hypothetical protein
MTRGIHPKTSSTSQEVPMHTRHEQQGHGIAGLVIMLASSLTWTSVGLANDREFTADFLWEQCQFSTRGRNPYFILAPGRKLILRGQEDAERVRVEITVLHDTEVVAGVETRVVEEREWIDGELVEVSRNFLARCRQTNDIFYFGEDVDDYEDGEIVGHDGAWRAGVDGALPGLIMPGTFLLGARYFQEIAPGVALDRAEHVAMGLKVQTPAGQFTNCVRIRETTPLEPGAISLKIYCPGVGLVVDDVVRLVAVQHVENAEAVEGGD